MSSRKILLLAAFVAFACLRPVLAETLDITAAPLGINSTRVPNASIVTADVATVTGGQYATSDDGTTSFLDVTGGTWNTADPDGAAHDLRFGAVDYASGKAFGPYAVTVAGASTQLKAGKIVAKFGSGRFEFLNGATLDTWGNAEISRPGGGSKVYVTNTIVIVDSSWTMHHSGQILLGEANKSYPSAEGICNLYMTNSTLTAVRDGDKYPYVYIANGTYVFKDCTATGVSYDYAFNVQYGAEVIIDNSAFSMFRYRIGGEAANGWTRPSVLTLKSGSLKTDKVFLGTVSSKTSAVLHQEGGLLTVNDLQACVGAQPVWLHLEGGELTAQYVRGMDKTKAKNPSGDGFARLTANGGRIKCGKAVASPLIVGWDLAEVGEKGLVLDSDGNACTVNQGFVNLEGESGRILKTGGGALTLMVPTDYTVSETCVDNGSLVVSAETADASVTLVTALTVTNGAALSTVGNAKDLTVGSLDINSASLKLDPGDSITVTGGAAFKGLALEFSTVPALNEAKDILTVCGSVSADSIKAFTSAVINNTFPAGTYGKLTARTTVDGTIFTVTTKNSPVVSGETKWRGPGAAWSDDANWTDGAPTETTEATFDDATAPATVTVSAVDVGALSFEAGSFTLQGEGPLTLAAPGASFVSVATGVHTVDVAVIQEAATPVTVAEGTALTLAKSVTGGGVVKEGLGLLSLLGANAFAGPMSIAAGMVSAGNAGALNGVGTLTLGDATLETTQPIALPSGADLTLAASAANKAVVVKNEDDLTVSAVTMGTGVLLKRGVGKLTIDARFGKCSTLANNTGDHKGGDGCNDTGSIVFPEDGTPPTGGFGGFTVLEGEVVVRGSGATPIAMDGAIHVGMNSPAARTYPVLTLDGVKVAQSKSIYDSTLVGYQSGNNAVARHPILRLVGGTEFSTRSIILDGAYSAVERYPVVAVTNATIIAVSESGSVASLAFSSIRQGAGYGAILAAQGTFKCDVMSVNGRTRSRLTGCTLQGYSGDYMKLSGDRNAAGEVLFDGGTVLKVNDLGFTDYMEQYGSLLTFAFDDATWDIGSGSLTINDANMDQRKPKEFEVRGQGLTLQVAVGQMLRTAAKFGGAGCLALTGGGTLKFDAGAFAVTGTVAAVNGTVDLTDAGTVSNLVVKGAGTISGAAFDKGVVIDPQIGDDWSVGVAPMFADCTFADRVTVECGHGEGTALALPSPEVVVARYTGTAPDVSRWRVRGTGGTGVRGAFTAANGEIKMTAFVGGLILIVR